MYTLRHTLTAVALVASVAGCATPQAVDTAAEERESLTRVVTELRMHLREDTYRHGRSRTRDGRNIYRVSLWKLDRFARQRARNFEDWENADVVIEFARARALARLGRFADAARAHRRVESAGSMLAEHASDAAPVLERFAGAAQSLEHSDLEGLDARIRTWRDLAWSLRGNPLHPLALEELEAWQMLRVDHLARTAPLRDAIAAQKRVIEEHSASKRLASHLIRLGDLYAGAARREGLLARTRRGLDAARYESYLERAFSAYEHAALTRTPAKRQEAETRIEALLAQHAEVSTHAP